MAEVIPKEDEKLGGFVLMHHLDTGATAFPFFVDGNDHAAARDRNRRDETS